MKKLFGILLAVVLVGCTNPESARSTLEGAGYKDITITGYSFFGCSEDDKMHTGFTAKGADGRRVTGVVCSGLMFKGSTIRIK